MPGYIEERNILFEHHYVEGGPELPAQLRHVRRCDHQARDFQDLFVEAMNFPKA